MSTWHDRTDAPVSVHLVQQYEAASFSGVKGCSALTFLSASLLSCCVFRAANPTVLAAAAHNDEVGELKRRVKKLEEAVAALQAVRMPRSGANASWANNVCMFLSMCVCAAWERVEGLMNAAFVCSNGFV